MKLILIIIIIYLLLHGGGYYGYRQGHYGCGCLGCVSVILLAFILMTLLGVPYWGWYDIDWYRY